MPLDLDNNDAQYQIRAYQPGTLVINEQTLTQSVIVAPNQLTNWAPQSADQITAADFLPIIALKPTVLLIGTGAKQIFISPALYGELINVGIGVEIMDTSAACRTYNALSSENRQVVAALVIK